MKLIKVKGIVVREAAYSESDKIVTILTDELGLISAIAKGARKTKSALLASTQYLVYSEFILFKGTSFYHINSAETISIFYGLKTDLDMLDKIYPMTRALSYLLNENVETSEILKTFLNVLYFMQEKKKNAYELVNIFRIRTVKLLGFFPEVTFCNVCKNNLDGEDIDKVYYDYVSNIFICSKCANNKSSRLLKIPKPCYMYIRYISTLDMKKCFAISLKEEYINDLDKFGQALIDCVCNSY